MRAICIKEYQSEYTPKKLEVGKWYEYEIKKEYLTQSHNYSIKGYFRFAKSGFDLYLIDEVEYRNVKINIIVYD